MGAFLQWGSNSLVFDIVTTETQNKSNMITEHPVEAGANITDHVRPNLDRVTIEAFVSNTPVYSDQGRVDQIVLDIPDPPTPFTLNGAIDLIGKSIGNLLNPKAQFVANVLVFDNAPDFVAQAISTLEELRIKAILVTIFCPSRVYDNMLLESFEVQGDADSGTGRTITMEFREIRTVSSSIVAAPTPSIKRANINQQKGAQAAEEAAKQKKSVLKGLIGGISASAPGGFSP